MYSIFHPSFSAMQHSFPIVKFHLLMFHLMLYIHDSLTERINQFFNADQLVFQYHSCPLFGRATMPFLCNQFNLLMCPSSPGVMKYFCMTLSLVWGTYLASWCRYVANVVLAGSRIPQLLVSSPVNSLLHSRRSQISKNLLQIKYWQYKDWTQDLS